MDTPDQKTPCQQIEENLDAFHDGELSADEKTPIEAHLKGCPVCVGKLAEIDRVVHALKSMPPAHLDAAASAKIDQLIDQQSKVVRLQPKVWAPLAVAAAAAALFVGVKFMSPESNVPLTAVNTDHNTHQQAAQSPVVATTDTQTRVAESHTSVPEQGASAGDHHPQAQPVKGLDNSSRPQAHSQPAAQPADHTQPASGKTLIAQQPTESTQAPYVSLIGSDANEDVVAADLPLAGPRMNDAIGLATDEDGLYDIKM